MAFRIERKILSKILKNSFRCYHLENELVAERLKSRSVLSIGGEDSLSFLQGLTTNDLRLLHTGSNSLYTLFLNERGKVIHDTIVFKPNNENILYVECDSASLQALYVHMTMYRGKKLVDIKSVEHELAVWNIHDPINVTDYINGKYSEDSFVDEMELDGIFIAKDPRLWALGGRILAPKEMDVVNLLRRNGFKASRCQSSLYKKLRYKLGVGEGTAEISYGRCSPAEVNADSLNGLDLKKDNYMGYLRNNGVRVEERLMPIKLETCDEYGFSVNTPIEDSKGKKKAPVGYLKGIIGNLGIALMNVSSALNDKRAKIGKTSVKCLKPPWWSREDDDDRESEKYSL